MPMRSKSSKPSAINWAGVVIPTCLNFGMASLRPILSSHSKTIAPRAGRARPASLLIAEVDWGRRSSSYQYLYLSS